MAITDAVWRVSPNRLVNGLAWCFSKFFRGAPALILLYMIYNGLATVGIIRNTVLWNVFIDPYYCAAIGLTLNHAGFLVEVVKGGIQAMPAGIIDASRALGLSRSQTFFLMTLPMALRYGLSAYMNEVILFAKGTAALGAMTVMDLLAVANSAVSTTYADDSARDGGRHLLVQAGVPERLCPSREPSQSAPGAVSELKDCPAEEHGLSHRQPRTPELATAPLGTLNYNPHRSAKP